MTRFKIDWGDDVDPFGGEASGSVMEPSGVCDDSIDVAASLKSDLQSHSSLSFPASSAVHETNGHASNGATDYVSAHSLCEPMQI